LFPAVYHVNNAHPLFSRASLAGGDKRDQWRRPKPGRGSATATEATTDPCGTGGGPYSPGKRRNLLEHMSPLNRIEEVDR
jgi:hypothetical protein